MKYWTTGEQRQLRQLYCVERKTCKVIARLLDRTPYGVKRKLDGLKLRKGKKVQRMRVRTIGNVIWLRRAHLHFEFMENLWPKNYSYGPPIQLN